MNIEKRDFQWEDTLPGTSHTLKAQLESLVPLTSVGVKTIAGGVLGDPPAEFDGVGTKASIGRATYSEAVTASQCDATSTDVWFVANGNRLVRSDGSGRLTTGESMALCSKDPNEGEDSDELIDELIDGSSSSSSSPPCKMHLACRSPLLCCHQSVWLDGLVRPQPDNPAC